MGNNRFQTLWRLAEGDHNLQSSIIAGLDEYIQRVCSGYPIEIQSWSGDELSNRKTSSLMNIPIPGIATVPNRGRSQGRFKSQREEGFKKRTASNNNSNSICDVPITGTTTITTKLCGFCRTPGHQQGYKCPRISVWNGTLLTKTKEQYNQRKEFINHLWRRWVQQQVTQSFCFQIQRWDQTVGWYWQKSDLVQKAWSFINNSLHTTIWAFC